MGRCLTPWGYKTCAGNPLPCSTCTFWLSAFSLWDRSDASLALRPRRLLPLLVLWLPLLASPVVLDVDGLADI